MTVKIERRMWWIYACAAVTCIVALCGTPWWTVDDAFIAYRYARNLVLDGVLTWNIQDSAPVEGYTGIFLPLLSAAIMKLGLPLVISIKILGVLAIPAIGWLVLSTMSRMGASPSSAAFTILLLSAGPPLYMHALSGLETIFFSLFMMGTFWGLAGVKTPGARVVPLLWFATFAVLVGLCRPEGIALAVLSCAFMAYKFGSQGDGASDRKYYPIVVLPVLVLLGYWAWRAGYYGSFLPNSYHAKRFDGLFNWDSVVALAKFGGYYCLMPSAGLLCVHWLAGLRGILPRLQMRWVAILFLVVCWGLYLHSSLWMNYGSRFFYPFLPVILVFLIHALDSAWSRLKQGAEKHRRQLAARWCIAGLAVLQGGVMVFRADRQSVFLKDYTAVLEEELIPAGQFLAEHFPGDARVISYMDAGAVGYFSGLEIIDFGRLNDQYLAQNKLSNAQVLEYFFKQDADAVVMTSESQDSFSYVPEAMSIVRDPRFRAYRLSRRWGNSVGFPYWQWLYVRE
jgi:hypothetical protein